MFESAAGDVPVEFFRTLLDAAPDAMIVVDPDGRVVFVNAEAGKMFGYRCEEMLGKSIEMLLPEQYRLRHEQHRRSYAAAPHVRPIGRGMELTGLRSDGREFPVEISLSPLRSSSGSLVVSAIRDITERHRVERELLSARQAADSANKAYTAFLSAASHDLRQPVQALSLLTGALQRTVQDPLALEMVRSQQESIDAMSNLLGSLLDISRLDTGTCEPRIEEFPVQGLICRLVAELSQQAMHKGLLLEAEPCRATVRSDPDLLGKIIRNFVSNALRYTDEGSVRLGCAAEGDVLSITVSDTGIGIARDQLEDIFREFHQVRSGRRNREGVGLGLAIARRLADLLGHEIAVESSPGAGSRFTVRVPIVAAAEPCTAPALEMAPGEPTASGLIILVEDDPQLSRAWEFLLRREGYRVTTAVSGAGARAAVHRLCERPDLIISDFHLADGSNGIEAVSAIREEIGACIPAFIATGDTSSISEQMEELADCRIVNKPVRPEKLLQLARDAIELGRPQ